MYFKQFYLGCLAHASYLIGSKGEAAVIDPQRDVNEYLEEAEAQGLEIKYVIETHLHADFVSGHHEIAARTGAEIVFGENANAEFEHRSVKDGDQILLGDVILQVLTTPGHTPEGISIVVIDTTVSNQPQKVLTGDTLFIGDVGRPDLAGGKGFTPQQMAGMLYDSLHEKLLKLADEVEVYPAHGAGSMCGKNMSKETSSTIGEQRKYNYALQPMSREAFVAMMTADLPEAPAYFPRDAEINRSGARDLAELVPPKPLEAGEVLRLRDAGHVLLDIRSSSDFGAAHVAGSINIGLGGQFAMWAGSLIPFTAEIVIIADTNAQIDEAVVRLARVGIENVRGYLNSSVESWKQAGLPVTSIKQVTVEQLNELLKDQRLRQIIDVRRPIEYQSGHIPGALTSPLGQDVNRLSMNRDEPTAVICAGGYRSSAAASLLESVGFNNLLNVTGGTSAWVNAGYPLETSTGS
jgi:glyoxylase-like metal-dependent hydrolase (beta-lactamase superfamily II)/rhodanese-related sulfurtransferase